MLRIICIILSASFFISCAKNAGINKSSAAKNDFKNAQIVYGQFCSSCHGEKVEAFVDRKWTHGQSQDSIVASITNGYLEAGMPSWQGTVSEDDIAEIADLIINRLSTVDQYNFEEVEKTDTYKSKGITVKLETVAEGLDSPWGMASMPDGNILVTDRSGQLYRVSPDQQKTEITGVPSVLSTGQGGLFEVKLHPNYAENGWIYLMYAKHKTDGGRTLSTTAMVRGKIVGNTLVQKEEIFEALPYLPTRHHYGGRMVFDKEGYLFFSVGDRGRRDINPQSLENHNGKIHRINADGSIPEDNPFIDTANAVKSIWSYGHRNPQGLVLNAETGEIWEHEHGPRGGDEVNLIQKGQNYGWPVISYGINYNATTFTNITEKEGMLQPDLYWIPSIAPCGMAYVSSGIYPEWQGDILAGSLRFNYLNRVLFEGNTIQGEEKLLMNVGRLRNVVEADDGFIYVGIEDLDGKGVVYRLIPQ